MPPAAQAHGAAQGVVATTRYDRAMRFAAPVPILRMFDLDKAKDFYVGFLGFQVDWEHRFEPATPVYMQVSRGDCRIHLSEHHGDGTPGTATFYRNLPKTP